ncbi:MAG: methyltransferase domain-containing protein [Anaerolineales bacterium]|jgi:demethylmenaquinone methyltransferase/2-methoxy-6-polyprenyl-1,4-benzoquinol methylase
MSRFDHFDFLAPLYDRVIRLPEDDHLGKLLGLPIEGRLLDAGGGTGRIAEGLKDRVGHLTIADASLPMLRQAHEKACCTVTGAHTERLPFAADSFERVIVIDAYHHLADQAESLHEFVRVVAPQGKLIIEEPDIDHFGVKLVALGEKLALMRSHFERAEKIAEQLGPLGVTVEIARENHNYWVIASKP